MGWFGFGGPRDGAGRDGNGRDANEAGFDRREWRPNAGFVHKAVRIDRAGPASRLPESRPRRRDGYRR